MLVGKSFIEQGEKIVKIVTVDFSSWVKYQLKKDKDEEKKREE